jgi:hypothetical protein
MENNKDTATGLAQKLEGKTFSEEDISPKAKTKEKKRRRSKYSQLHDFPVVTVHPKVGGANPKDPENPKLHVKCILNKAAMELIFGEDSENPKLMPTYLYDDQTHYIAILNADDIPPTKDKPFKVSTKTFSTGNTELCKEICRGVDGVRVFDLDKVCRFTLVPITVNKKEAYEGKTSHMIYVLEFFETEKAQRIDSSVDAIRELRK